MDTFIPNVAGRAEFSADKMGKTTLHESASMMLGLNALEPGQSQAAHVHAGADKFYYVLEGRARFVVGSRMVEAGAGDLVVCPAGEPHGIETAIERTTVLVAIAPWKTRSKE